MTLQVTGPSFSTQGQVFDTAYEMATDIARNCSPQSVCLSKTLLTQGLGELLPHVSVLISLLGFVFLLAS